LIRILSRFAGGSTFAAKTLLDLNISSIVRDVLAGSSLVPGMSGSLALDRPTDQVLQLLSIVRWMCHLIWQLALKDLSPLTGAFDIGDFIPSVAWLDL